METNQNGLPVPLTSGGQKSVKVEAFTHPFRNEKVECLVPHGVTLLDIIGDLPRNKLEIWVDGEHLPRKDWLTVPRQGATVTIRAVPQRDVVRAALQIALVVAAVYFAGPAGANLAVGTAAHAAFVGGVTLAGNLLINAIIPPAVIASPPAASSDTKRLGSLTGASNRVARFDPIPRLFGHMRYFPPVPMTGMPYTEMVGGVQYLRALYILGYGPLDINGVTVSTLDVKTLDDYPDLAAAIRIGETTLDNFEDVELEVGDPEQFTLYTQSVVETRVDLAMNSIAQEPGTTVTENIQNTRTTEPDTSEISIDLEFPVGLFSINNDGSDNAAEVSFTVEYRVAGSGGAWSTVNFDQVLTYYGDWRGAYVHVIPGGSTEWVIRGNTRQTLRRGLRWKVAEGQYEVRLTRVSTYNAGAQLGSTNVVWLTLKSIFSDRPFGVNNVVGLAIRIRSSDELSGVLDNLSVEATSLLPTISAAPDEDFIKLPAEWGGVIGGIDDFTITPNESLTAGVPTANLAELTVAGTIFHHPDGNVRALEAAIVSVYSTIGEGLAGTFYLMWSDENVATRFGFSPSNLGTSRQLIPILYQVGEGWRAVDNSSNMVTFTPKPTDCIIAVMAADATSGGIDQFQKLTWNYQVSSSPAWAFVDALTGIGTRRPLNRNTEINIQDIIDWAAAAESNGFEFNYVCEGRTTLFDLIRMITAAGRAAWALRNGKLSVIREETEQTPRQLFSPRNATNFRLNKSFPKVPHALRVQFVDPTNWEDGEIIVFDDGYTEDNATLYETLSLPGVTSHEQAWKLGRFHLAQMRLRPETFVFDAYIDTLIAQRGDAIAINNDAFLNGLATGRIKTTNGGNLQTGGDFESGVLSDWTASAPGASRFLTTDDAYRGKYSLAMVASGAPIQTDARGIEVTPGDYYRAWCYIKAEDAVSGRAYVNIRWALSNGTLVTKSLGNSVHAGEVGWILSYVQGVVPPTATLAQVSGIVTDSIDGVAPSGTFLFDEFHIERTGTDGKVTTFEADEQLFMEESELYFVSVRYTDENGDPAIATSEITTVSPSTRTVTLAMPLPNRVMPGDLFVFGTTPTIDAKILKIEPDDDLHATITAVPLSPEILTADTGTIPEYDPLLNNPIDFEKLPPQTPEILRVRSDETVLYRDVDGSLKVQLVVDFKFPPGQAATVIQMRIAEQDTFENWRYYEVASDTGKIATTEVLQGFTYEIQLRARNSAGKVSAWSSKITHQVVGKSSPPSDVTGFTATVEDFGIVLTWDDIADIDRDEFEVRTGASWNDGTLIARLSGTTLRTGITAAGTQNFYIKAIDTSGNYSTNAASTTATISAPTVSGVTQTFVGANVELKWAGVQGSFGIREYEIRRGGSSWETATPVTTIRTTTFRQEADWLGDETWWIAAIDVAGNTGTATSIIATVIGASIQSVNPEVIDNNVLLRWIPIQGTLPIARYEVRRGQTFVGAEIIGVADTTFSAITESRGGTYTYWVVPIDSAGNEGTEASVTTQVNEPPDFVLQSDFYSDGLGNNTNVQRITNDSRSIRFVTGNDDYVSLPNTILDGKTNCTIELAVAFDAIPTSRYIIFGGWDGITASAQNICMFGIYAPTDSGIDVRVWPFGSASATWTVQDINLFDGRRRMFSIVRNQTGGTVELFIDGMSRGTVATTLSTLDIAADTLILGTWVSYGNGLRQTNEGLTGRIDEVRFWGDIRTPTEIGDYYDRELDLNEDNLTAYYRFNLHGNQITADDISPNDNNGSIFAEQNLPIPELLIPFPTTETVQDKLNVHGYATPQAQITAGYDYVAQPVPLTASIEEIYNCGVVLPASRLQVLQTLTDIAGTGVTASVTISTKELITDPWTSHGVGEDDVYATSFQYIKVRIDYTAANAESFALLTQLATKGFVKRKTDEGTIVVSANPTSVTFNVDFIDVESIVATVMGTTFALAIIDFTDTPFPTGFDVYTFDAAGNAITGRTVKWIARGV